MSEYREVLHKWAKQFIESNRRDVDVSEIVNVEFNEYEASGYCETCWSPGYTSINIDYLTSKGEKKSFYETSDDDEGFKMGDILTELFAIAEKEE